MSTVPSTAFERGYRQALALLVAVVGIQARAAAARKLLDQLAIEAVDAEYQLHHVAGWRLALLDTVADAAAYAFDLYRDEQPTDRTSETYKALRDSAFRAKDDADAVARAVSIPLVHEVIATVAPATIDELLDLAVLVADADAGRLDVVTVTW